MNRNVAAITGLGGGLLIGAMVRASGNDGFIAAARLFQPLGTLWINALEMTLVPLVFALVAHGMVTLDRNGGGGKLLAGTMSLLLGLLAVVMAGGIAFGILFERLWPVAPGAAGALGTTTAVAPGEIPTLPEMIVALVPTNPVAAASQGALASVVVFAVVFGFAASRIDRAAGAPIIAVLHGLAETMMRIVHWVLWFAPLGIFALSLGLAQNAGLAMAGFLVQGVILVVIASLLTIVLGYLLAWFGGGVSPIRFGRAIIGAQAMAAGTTSSAATLPLMIEAAQQKLEIPEQIVGAVLPLTVSVFRAASVCYNGAVLILFMRAENIPLDPGKLAVGSTLLVLGIMSTGGLPGAAVIYAATSAAYKFLGLPLEFIPLMIAISALPDMLVTTGNVTADLAVVTVARTRCAGLACEVMLRV